MLRQVVNAKVCDAQRLAGAALDAAQPDHGQPGRGHELLEEARLLRRLAHLVRVRVRVRVRARARARVS